MFVKTEGPEDAKIMLVGEAPGEEEDRTGRPFRPNAPAGRTLNKLLSKANLSRQELSIANVARERPPGNKVAFFFEDYKRRIPKEILSSWLHLLKCEIEERQPNIIVALGATALWALTGKLGIEVHRGYITESTLVPGIKVMPTFHPQRCNYNYKDRWATIMDLRKAVKNSASPGMPKDNRSLQTNMSRLEYVEWLKHLYYKQEGDPLAVDIETANPGCHIDIMGIADSAMHGVAFTILANRKPKYSLEKEAEVWYWIAKVFSNHPLIMQNGSFDMCVLWLRNHVLCKDIVFDTMIAAHVCWPECPRSLAFLGSICLNVPEWKSTSNTFPAMYNAGDATNTFGIFEVLSKEIDRNEQREVFNREMEQLYPSAMMQLQGIPVDEECRSELYNVTTARLDVLEAEIEIDVGKKINLNSPKQLQNLLYLDMGLPEQFKRRKSASEPRKITSDAESLIKLSRKTNNPVLDKILEAKKLIKLKGSFLSITASPEGKVHTSYNITGATMAKDKKGLVIDNEDSHKSFGRWSSSKSIILPYGSGNLQNIPEIARKMYRVPPGYMITRGDYKQAEAVVVAYEIRDILLITLFKESFGLSVNECNARNLDVHKLTAATNFNIPITAVLPAQRTIGKTIRHATNYSAGPGVLAAKLDISIQAAKKLLQRFHDTCPQLRLWHGKIRQQLGLNRVLVNLLGRKHTFLDRWGDNLYRSSYSYIPQSTVGDLLNQSLVRFYNAYGTDIAILLQLHDAIYNMHRVDEAKHVRIAMREKMLYPLTSSYGEEYTIDIDFGIGDSWGELEDVLDEGTYN